MAHLIKSPLTIFIDFPPKTLPTKPFKGACDAGDLFVHYMSVMLCCFDDQISHKFLKYSDIDTIFNMVAANLCLKVKAILILEPYAFEVKKVIVFINVISMGYASRNSIKNYN